MFILFMLMLPMIVMTAVIIMVMVIRRITVVPHIGSSNGNPISAAA